MLRYLYLLIFSLLSQVVKGQDFTPQIDSTMWVTNGTVKAIVRSGNTIYLGGSFSYVGPTTGGGAPLSKSNGTVNGIPLQINGSVTSSVSDGLGGWFIGGSFTKIGSVPRNCIAHILPNNSVDLKWNPHASNTVLTLALNGNILYVAGSFRSIGGQNRAGLAALNASTGLTTSWDPNPSGGTYPKVLSLAVFGKIVYVGGTFSNIGGQNRNRIASLDSATGLATK